MTDATDVVKEIESMHATCTSCGGNRKTHISGPSCRMPVELADE